MFTFNEKKYFISFARSFKGILCVALVLAIACSKDKTPLEPKKKTPEITWADEPVTVYMPQSGGVWYPRLLQLDDGTLLCAYDTNEDAGTTYIGLSKSTNNGQTWVKMDPIYVSSFAAANPHLIQTSQGILCVFREVASNSSFYIKISKSTDGGRTWTFLSTVDHNSRGLWEPFFLKGPNQKLMVFYSSESFQPDYSQVIAMRTSPDRGKTWGKTTIVSKNPFSRDGMPIVVKLSEKEWLCFFEATDEANPFVIKIVRSTDGGVSWSGRQPVYLPASPNRMASAPYGIQLQDGRLLCSFQTDETRDEIGLGKVDMKVVFSTDNGEHWGDKTTIYAGPFGVWWNSLIQLKDGTILAATSTNDSGRMAIKLIFGDVNG